MATEKLIENLNRALSLELAGSIQYRQHSFLITGTERQLFCDWFREQGQEASDHTIWLGDKIVALGGIPTVEPALIRQATELSEMLKQDLELEREAMDAYLAAHADCETAHLPTKFQLEERIAEEQKHIEELEKYTSERTANVNRERIVLREVV